MLGDPLSFLFPDEVAEGPPPMPATPCPPPARPAANDSPTGKPWIRPDGASLVRSGKQWADQSTGEIVGLGQPQPQPEPQHTPAPTPDAARAAWWRAVRDLGVWDEDGTPAVPGEARLST